MKTPTTKEPSSMRKRFTNKFSGRKGYCFSCGMKEEILQFIEGEIQAERQRIVEMIERALRQLNCSDNIKQCLIQDTPKGRYEIGMFKALSDLLNQIKK